MKKKLLAVVLAMAMTLGMGAVASADATTESTAVLTTNKVEEMKAGDKVTVTISTSQEVMMSAFDIRLAYDPEVVKVSTAANKFGQYATYDESFTYAGGSKVNNLDAAGNEFIWTGANADYAASTIEAGAKICALEFEALKDIAVDDVVATLKVAFITDDFAGNDYMKAMSIEIKAIEKATEAPTEAPTQAPTQAPTNGTQAPTNGTQATTTKALTKADAMNAVTDLSKAVALADKLSKDAFANASDYEAFAKALANAKAVLANAKATDAEKAAALDALKTLIAKADDAAVVKAATDAGLVGTTTAATTAKVDNTKTGDASNALALMIVAIAAFGTAVVVYRKKVNA